MYRNNKTFNIQIITINRNYLNISLNSESRTCISMIEKGKRPSSFLNVECLFGLEKICIPIGKNYSSTSY